MGTFEKRSQSCNRMAKQEGLLSSAAALRKTRNEVISRAAAAREMHDEMASRAADTMSHQVVTKVLSSMTREEIIATILRRA